MRASPDLLRIEPRYDSPSYLWPRPKYRGVLHALGAFAGAGGDGHAVAVRGEGAGDGQADAAVASGDEDAAAGGLRVRCGRGGLIGHGNTFRTGRD